MDSSQNDSGDYDNIDYGDIEFWNNLENSVHQVLDYQHYLKFFFAVIGVFVNIFHLIVLTRKSLRVLTINLFITGIAICDFLRLLSDVLGALPKYYEKYQKLVIPIYCIPPNTYVPFLVMTYSVTVSTIATKLAVWFGVAMAVLRVFVIKYPLSRRIQNLINSKYGIRILLIVCLPHIPFWVVDFKMFRILEIENWKRPSQCSSFTVVTKRMQYSLEPGESLNDTMLRVEAILFTVLPSILLSIATGFLIYFLKTMKRPTASRKNDSNDRSTKIVALVAVTFVLATAPLGISYFIQTMSFHNAVFFIIDVVTHICEFLSLINGSLHFLLCLCISSQYQEAVKQMFGSKRTRITTTTFVS